MKFQRILAFLGIATAISLANVNAVDLNIDNLNLSKKELQIFIKAYTLGKEDAYKDFNFLKRKTLSYLKDIYITKKLIKAGDLRIVVKSQIQPLGNNQFRIVRVYTFEIVKPQDLVKNKAFLRRIEEKVRGIENFEGYWVYMKIDNIPDPIQGLIEYALLKEGLKPQRFGNVLIAGIFSSKADAKMWKKLLKERYNLDFAIASVENGKTLDPVIQSLINSYF